MRRLCPVVLVALLALPAPARATIRVVDLRTGHVHTLAASRGIAPLAWHGRTMIGADARPSGTTLRRYPGGALLLRWPGAGFVTVRGDRVAGAVAATERTDRVVVRTLHGRRLAARVLGGMVDSLAWSPGGARLAAGWTDRSLHSHLTILTGQLKPLRTVDAPSSVRMSDAAWAPDGRTLTYATETERISSSGGPLPGQVRSLDFASGRQSVRFRGTRCDALACELVDDPVSAPGGRVAFLRDLTGVTLLRPGAAPRALALPTACREVDAVAWAGRALAAVYLDRRRSRLALLHPGGRPRTIATLPGTYGRLLVSGRRAAVG